MGEKARLVVHYYTTTLPSNTVYGMKMIRHFWAVYTRSIDVQFSMDFHSVFDEDNGDAASIYTM